MAKRANPEQLYFKAADIIEFTTGTGALQLFESFDILNCVKDIAKFQDEAEEMYEIVPIHAGIIAKYADYLLLLEDCKNRQRNGSYSLFFDCPLELTYKPTRKQFHRQAFQLFLESIDTPFGLNEYNVDFMGIYHNLTHPSLEDPQFVFLYLIEAPSAEPFTIPGGRYGSSWMHYAAIGAPRIMERFNHPSFQLAQRVREWIVD